MTRPLVVRTRNNAIRSAYATGNVTLAQLAKQYQVSASRIGQIISKSDFRRAKYCCVYFVRCGDFIKIGVALDLQLRFSQLQAGCPLPLTLLGAIQGGRELEAELHAKFSDSLHRHEWFKVTDRLLEFIKTASNIHLLQQAVAEMNEFKQQVELQS